MTRDSPHRPFRHQRLWLALALSCLLWSCAATPPDPAHKPARAHPGDDAERPAARLVLPPSPYRAQFNEVEAALATFDWKRASVALGALAAQPLAAEDAAYARYLEARIAWVRGAPDLAAARLAQAEHPDNSAALDYRIATFHYHMLTLGGNALGAARLAAGLLVTAPPASAAAWRRNSWRDLQRADEQALAEALESAVDPQWAGWLQLALASRAAPHEVPARLHQWLAEHPGHPAAAPLPGGLDYLLDSASGTRKTALLLPLSGQLAAAGRAVLDGFLAAHYQSGSGGSTELIVLDSASYKALATAYDTAVLQGADVVVGPLDKAAVADLGLAPRRPVPVLALNRIDGPLPPGDTALVQFALAPEDELASLAEHAFGRGARAALLLRPSGAWGDDMARTLRDHWAGLGGTVVSAASYTDQEDHSRAVRQVLGLDASEARARAVRGMLATNIEFTPRRRLDPEVIFLLARDAAEARSIKPLLTFHFAGAVPVYAPSGIYSGTPDDRDRDLDGIRVMEMPWRLGHSRSLREALAAADTGGHHYDRLNALGADAYLLQSQLPRLASGAAALFRGSTGLLSLDPQLRIRREPFPAVFDGAALRRDPLH